MADIPTYNPISAQVLPTASPVQSLDGTINAITKGLAAGQSTPSTISSIAQGIQGGIQNYQSTRINEAKITTAEAQAATAPGKVAATNAENQTKTTKAQYDNNILLQKQALNEILKSGDTQKINEAFTSGEYAPVFGADPTYATAVFRTAGPYLTPDVTQFYLNQEKGKQSLSSQEKFNQKQELNRQKANQEYENSDLLHHIRDKNPDLTPYDILRRGEVEQANKYKLNEDGTYARDPQTDAPILNEFDPTAKAANSLYNIRDTKTGKLLISNLQGNDKELLNFKKTRSLSNGNPSSEYAPGPIEQGIAQSEGRVATIQEPKKEEPVPTAPTQAPVVQRKYSGPRLTEAQDVVSKTNFITPSGTTDIANNETAKTALATAVGLKDITPYESDIKTVLSAAEYDPSFSKIEDPEARQHEVNNVAGAKRKIITASLKDSYDATPEATKSSDYTDESVKAHNKQVAAAIELIKTPHLVYGGDPFGALSASTTSIPASQLIYADNPEELYIIRQYDATSSRLDSVINSMRNRAAEQNTSRIVETGAPTAVLQVANRYK